MNPRPFSARILPLLALAGCAALLGAADGPPASSTWELVFSDDFNGTALDPSKWMTPWSSSNRADNWRNVGWSWEWMDDDNVEVTGGLCRIHAQKEGTSWKSGVIQTAPTFQQTYGYCEARIKVATGYGYLSAFWMACENTWPPEIDMVEVLGKEPTIAHMTTHDHPNNTSSQANAWTGPDLSQAFHTYGCEWNAQNIIYYIDGIERARHVNTNGFLSLPMFLICNVHIGNSWAGYPTDTPPGVMEIDWVRAYRRTGTGTGGGTTGSLPDLVVTGISSSPAAPVAGDKVRFSATVTNQGTAATPAGTVLGASFWVDGAKLTWSDTDTAALAPGASVTLTANGPTGADTWTAAAGAHTVMAWVDDIDRIVESRDDNNQRSVSLTVATSSGGGSGGGGGSATAPAITSPLTASGTVGTPFTYTVAATGTAPLTIAAAPLPAGLRLAGAVISGTPSAAGTTPVTLTVTNAAGSDSGSLVITIADAPVTGTGSGSTGSSGSSGSSGKGCGLGSGIVALALALSFALRRLHEGGTRARR
jgi:beta-glucanase (GH16 family)